MKTLKLTELTANELETVKGGKDVKKSISVGEACVGGVDACIAKNGY